jgi:hypothetical protein
MSIRFYTLPPKGVAHEYIFVNPRSANELYRRKFSHAICDSGVHYFYENPQAQDYPTGYMERYIRLAQKLAVGFGDRVWITIPDYPDDYHPGQFGDNVERTLMNIEQFVRIKDISWIPTIQASYKNKRSFEYCCKQLRRIDYFERVAIGTVCKVRDLKFISECCRIARKHFPKSWIHAFGPPLNAVPHIMHYINSFDSAAWTFPRSAHNSSCKTARERREYFLAYLSLLSDKLNMPNTSILDFINNSH